MNIFKAKRSQQKSRIQNEADRLEQLLLESLAKEHIVKQAIGDPEKLALSPPKLKLKPARTEERDEMFKLPPLKDETSCRAITNEEPGDESEEEDEELCPKRSYDVNINQIDVTSSHFKSLPADIRHDILTDIKETRKQNSWARLRELPVELPDFSGYQMSRLLRRRQVQIGLEEAEKEMGGKTWSLAELETLLADDGVLDSKHCQKIASDENTRFLLVRDIAKAMNEAKVENEAGPSTSNKVASPIIENTEPSTSTQVAQSSETLDDEDFDLQRAIQLSLGNDPDAESPIEPVEPSARVKLNPQQRQKFSGTIQAHGLIRGFMMEYAEMNGDDIQDLMDATQAVDNGDALTDPYRAKFPNTDEYILYGTPKKIKSQTVGVCDISDTDEDLVEVGESSKPANKGVVITLEADLKDFNKEDDLFADVFESSKDNLEVEVSSTEAEDVPDVEVASISSDDDTLPYDVPKHYFDDLDEQKEPESGFVSEDGKTTENTDSSEREADVLTEIGVDTVEVEPAEEASENEKFWKSHDIPQIIQEAPASELSENEKFWSNEAPTLNTSALNDVFAGCEPVMKTPVKVTREVSPPPAKVPSPFFVNRKTPSSKKKQEEPVTVNASGVSKTLFPVEDKTTALQRAAQELRDKNTSEELAQMKDQLVDDQKNLAQERNKLDRMGASITNSMSRDCKDLLKLFGIPYIDSPMEAEAQCAFLNMIDLTDGTISDDSDIWLFGGQTVYKNFFVQKKIVMEFRHENIDEMFHLDRKKLIQLAMLVGSDYTVGINGIGAVTALEILAAFPPTPESEAGTDQYQSLVSSLRKFRDWFHNGRESGPGGRSVLKSKLKNVELFEGFPSVNVAKAYLEPTVDTNAEKFSWGLPDTESLVEYAKNKLGWTRMKTEEIMAPVMKRLSEKKQATIKDYFKSQVTKKFFENNKMSKRVQKAVGKMGGAEDEVEEKPNKTRKRKATAKKDKVEEASAEAKDDNVVVVLSDDDQNDASPPKKSSPKPQAGPSTNKTSNAQKVKPAPRKRKPKEVEPSTTTSETVPVKKRAPRIPETKQVIPQREKDKEEQEKIKQKAIDIFKKSKGPGKKT